MHSFKVFLNNSMSADMRLHNSPIRLSEKNEIGNVINLLKESNLNLANAFYSSLEIILDIFDSRIGHLRSLG